MGVDQRYLELPGGGRIGVRRLAGAAPEVLFLPGLRSNMAGTKATRLEALCRKLGLAYTRFDYSAHGISPGKFEQGTIGRWRDEAVAVIDAVCERPLLLVGSSLGGWIALLVALERRERVRGLVAVAPAPDFTEDLLLARLSEDERAAFDRTGRLEVPSAYDPEPTVFTWQLITEARQHLLMRRPIPLRMPVHLLHGQADPDVPWQISLDLAARLDSADVTVELIKDGEHRLSRPEDLERLDAAVLRLARRLRGPRAFPFA